ncbi:hypothetical protein CR513_54113, partial [Mucuna pruriens]
MPPPGDITKLQVDGLKIEKVGGRKAKSNGGGKDKTLDNGVHPRDTVPDMVGERSNGQEDQ